MTLGVEHSVEFAGALSIRDAANLKITIETALAAHPAVVIDCTALTAGDIAIVQLLAAARKTAATAGKSLRLRSPAGGALAALLKQTGILGADGRPRALHGNFWIGETEVEAA